MGDQGTNWSSSPSPHTRKYQKVFWRSRSHLEGLIICNCYVLHHNKKALWQFCTIVFPVMLWQLLSSKVILLHCPGTFEGGQFAKHRWKWTLHMWEHWGFGETTFGWSHNMLYDLAPWKQFFVIFVICYNFLPICSCIGPFFLFGSWELIHWALRRLPYVAY